MPTIILDTDLAMGTPGSDVDDGFALALALTDPDIDLDLVTTVNGNTDVDSATALTLDLLERLGHADVPVVRGAEQALRGWRHPPPSEPIVARSEGRAKSGYAAVEIVERAMADPGTYTLVGIGPLTNIALALSLEPALAANLREVVVMGGVFLRTTQRSDMPGEFNTFCDPDAAAIVLASGVPLRFVGLDVTTQVRLTRDHTESLRRTGREFAAFAADCADGWIDHLERSNPGDPAVQGSCALHDPLALASVTRPDLITWRSAYVQVETGSAVTRGLTFADLLTSQDPPRPNCRIAVGVNASAFLELFLERISGL